MRNADVLLSLRRTLAAARRGLRADVAVGVHGSNSKCALGVGQCAHTSVSNKLNRHAVSGSGSAIATSGSIWKSASGYLAAW